MCGSDAALRAQLEALLAAHDPGDSFLEAVPALTGPFAHESGTAVEAPGDSIGPYTLVKLIGEGGFGNVYLAAQSRPVRRQVALKIIKLGMDTKQVIARFNAERRALAMMDHPTSRRCLTRGPPTPAGRSSLWSTSKVFRSRSIVDERHLTMHERLHLFIDVCLAVQHAHQKGGHPSIVSLTDKRPRDSRSSTPAAMNCLPSEPMSKTVCVVIGKPSPRSAVP